MNDERNWDAEEDLSTQNEKASSGTRVPISHVHGGWPRCVEAPPFEGPSPFNGKGKCSHQKNQVVVDPQSGNRFCIPGLV